jgi:hypothetical protein
MKRRYKNVAQQRAVVAESGNSSKSKEVKDGDSELENSIPATPDMEW